MKMRVVVLPSAQVSQMVASRAKRLARGHNPLYVVDNRKLYPHITLCKVEVGKKNVPGLQMALAAFAAQCKPFIIHVKRLHLWRKGLAFSFGLEPVSRLKSLMKAVTKVAGRYGTVKKIYPEPHITLARFNDRKAWKKLPEQKTIESIADFRLRTIALGLHDSHNQIYKIVEKYKVL